MKIRIPIPPSELKTKELPQAPHFVASTTLRVGDLNYGNHMGNDTVLSLAHEFRLQFFNKYGQSELSFFGLGIIMSDSAIQYRAQGFWGQEITAKLWYIPTGATRFDLYYQLQSPKENGQGHYDVAYIKTGQVFFNYDTQKVATPDGDNLESYEKFLNELAVSTLC